jgi:hypothetical protein
VQESYTQHLPRDIHGAKVPKEYIGIDIAPGPGVDYVCNLARPGEIDKLPIKKFKTIHIHCVMEHVDDIFSVARNIEELLDDDGVLLFSAPFAWRIHRIPVDLWRFTPQGVDYLFPHVEFLDQRSCVHTRHGDECYPITDAIPEFGLTSGLNKQPAHIRLYVKLLRKLGLHNNIFNERALLFESTICMYGIKRKDKTFSYLNLNKISTSTGPSAQND